MKKFLVFLIAACMLITCFACGGNDKDKKPGGSGGGNLTTGERWANLPDKDYDGKDFRISTRGGYGAIEVVVADESSENVVDQAIIYRNARVEDRFDIYIDCQNNDGTAFAHTNLVLAACTEQTDVFDLAMTYVYESAPLITNGFVLNWNKLPYTNLDQSQWINGMNDAFSVRDAVYTTISKMCISILEETAVMLYNRDLGNEWKGDEFSAQFIETVLAGDGVEGGWTYDYLMSLVNEYGWVDATNDGRTGDDTYAFYMTRDWSIDTWHAAWEMPCIKNTVENGLEDIIMNDKYLTYASRMQTMYYDTPAIYYSTRSGANDAFAADRALFVTAVLGDTHNVISNKMESTYTILPQPKFDENQKEYRSAMFDNYSVMSIPITADPEFVSLIVEALSIASEENVYSAYRYDTLQGTGVSDADSIEMLDIVLNNTTWDIATLLSSNVRMINMVRYDVINNIQSSQISQTYKSRQGEIKDSLTAIMNAFDAFQDN